MLLEEQCWHSCSIHTTCACACEAVYTSTDNTDRVQWCDGQAVAGPGCSIGDTCGDVWIIHRRVKTKTAAKAGGEGRRQRLAAKARNRTSSSQPRDGATENCRAWRATGLASRAALPSTIALLFRPAKGSGTGNTTSTQAVTGGAASRGLEAIHFLSVPKAQGLRSYLTLRPFFGGGRGFNVVGATVVEVV